MAKELTPEQFTAGLALATRLAERGIDPCSTLSNLLALAKELTPEQYRRVELAEAAVRDAGAYLKELTPYRQAELGIDPFSILSYLPASAKELTPEQFTAVLVLATCLADRGIDPSVTLSFILKSGLLAAAKALTPEQFAAGLALATRLVHPSYTLAKGSTVTQVSLTPETIGVNLKTLEHTVTGLLAGIIREAIALKKQYADFKLIYHPGGYGAEENRFGYLYRRYYPPTVELRPVGRRIAEIPLEVIEETRLETLLTQRSWLWQFYADHDTRKQALNRIASLCAFLSSIIDQLIRYGVLKFTERLVSVYLIGSYPWVPAPADIDLFLVVEGTRQGELAGRLAERVWPELLVPLSVEVVGHTPLLLASKGELGWGSWRLPLRHTLLYGSVLLAGHDIFETTSVRREALEALEKDLLVDRKPADWPELRGDRTKIQKKKKWRQVEVNALREFIRQLPSDTRVMSSR